MSWSYSAKGRASAVKADVTEKFAQFKPSLEDIKHEHASAALTEEILDGQLNFAIVHCGDPIVSVHANGSSWTNGNGSGSSTHHVSFEFLGPFLGV